MADESELKRKMATMLGVGVMAAALSAAPVTIDIAKGEIELVNAWAKSGESGESGESGGSGDSGESGDSSDSGESGESGDSSASGESGESGDSGESGESAADRTRENSRSRTEIRTVDGTRIRNRERSDFQSVLKRILRAGSN